MRIFAIPGTSLIGALFLSIGLTETAAAQNSVPLPDPSHISITLPKDLKWSTGVEQQQANLFGDPSKPGLYGVLYRWAPNHFSKPHFHTTDRYVYVVSGTWWVSASDTYDPDKTYPVPAGSFVVDIANTVHWDGAKGEPCILEVVGEGPMKTVPVPTTK